MRQHPCVDRCTALTGPNPVGGICGYRLDSAHTVQFQEAAYCLRGAYPVTYTYQALLYCH